MKGVKGIPPRRYMFPKSYLGAPDRVSMPMLARRMPSIVMTTPRMGFSPTSQLMEVMAISSRAVISEGPNLRPMSASAGPMKVRMIIPMVPPMQDATFAVISACPGLFRFEAIGYPSIAVMIAGESPGIFSRIALNAPPYMLE